MIGERLRARVEARLGQRVRAVAPATGGDINDSYRLGLADGSSVFLKTSAQAPPGLFAAEARGLEFLAEAGALRVPRVLGYGEGPADLEYLVLEFIPAAPRKRDFDEELGRGLAALHRAGAPSFGFREANFIGRLPQSNRECASWSEFYRLERLEPQLAFALAEGRASLGLRRDFERLYLRLPEIVCEPEAPARLHGDLWSGNVHVDERGAPCLIDPAVYGGDREMDLAMMRLFGGFSERVFAAYEEAYPLPSGHLQRVSLHQLYPLLVHLNLFGASYLGSVQAAVSEYL